MSARSTFLGLGAGVLVMLLVHVTAAQRHEREAPKDPFRQMLPGERGRDRRSFPADLPGRSGGERVPERTLLLGSKRFTESIVLAEIGLKALADAGVGAKHVEGLGGTAIVYRALEEGSIDAYPEYLGTLTEAILHEPGLDLPAARIRLQKLGLDATEPMGFENGYALAVRKGPGPTAAVITLADLASHPTLQLGLSNEFLARADGWPRLRERYGLAALSPRGLDHGLAYAALAAGSIDVLDVYTTDASLARYDLRLLEDNAHAFPSYEAIWLHRIPGDDQERRAVAALASVHLTREEMVRANDAFERGGLTARQIATARVRAPSAAAPVPARPSFLSAMLDVIRAEGPRHLFLVAVSLFFAVALGVPLGFLAARSPRLGAAILGVTALLQTIPALALLCFFIPLFGIGKTPTIVALFVYGLLPIVRNTTLGFRGLPASLRDSALALGLADRDRLVRIELPLALPSILAGIRTAAVLDVGTATVAAFVGAGGFGQPISAGLSMNDTRLILTGALPAAGLAALVELSFAAATRVLVPGALRRASEQSSERDRGP